MIVSCFSVFMSFLILFLLLFIFNNRRFNIIFFFSGFIGLIVSIIFATLFENKVINIFKLLNDISGVFIFPKDVGSVLKINFAYGFLMFLMFVLTFAICFFIFYIFIPREYCLGKKSNMYLVYKTLFVILNVTISAYFILYIISTLNIIYQMPTSFLDYIIELFQERIIHI